MGQIKNEVNVKDSENRRLGKQSFIFRQTQVEMEKSSVDKKYLESSLPVSS